MTNNKKIMYIIPAVLITAVMLVMLLLVEKKMDSQIKTHHLRYEGQVKSSSPLVSFTTVALGGLRGLIADLLWLRVNSLQQKGNYYEMVQLGNWIADLQPDFPGAASFLAWNMAYNISVTCSFYDDRWRWVNEGIKLLRDKAIIHNPEEAVLYKELGWIFQHKIGNVLDDAQKYYKNQLANDMRLVVTEDPDWQGIADAPENDKEFLKKYPENSFVGKALIKAGYQRDNMKQFHADFRNGSKVPEKLKAALDNNQTLINLMDNYLRAEYLRDKYKLDPDLILELNNKYGELDWRLPEAQSIYWATMGLRKTPGGKSIDCERMITQSLFEASRSGRLLIVDTNDFKDIMLAPNFNVLDAAKMKFEETIDDYPDINSFASAKKNFMKDAIMLLYSYGKFGKAREYFDELCKEHPKENFGNFEEYAMKIFLDEVKSGTYKKTMDMIDGMLKRSFTYLIYGDDDAFIGNEKIARAIHAKFKKEFEAVDRLKMPSYQEIKTKVLKDLYNETTPEIRALLETRLKLDKSIQSDKTDSNKLLPVNEWDTNPLKKFEPQSKK